MSLIYRIYQVQIVLGYVTHKSLRQQCTKRLVAQGRTIPFDREVNSSAIRSDFYWVGLFGGGGGGTGRRVRRWPTGKIAESPIATNNVARIGLLSVVRMIDIPPCRCGEFIIECNECENNPQSRNLSEHNPNQEETIVQYIFCNSGKQ